MTDKKTSKSTSKKETLDSVVCKVDKLLNTFSNKSNLSESSKAMKLIDSCTDYIFQRSAIKLLKGTKIVGEISTEDVGKKGHKIKVLKVVNGNKPDNVLFKV